jgi:hypothetical protein
VATETLRPDGDGASHTTTPSTGTEHFSLVDEAVEDTADYCYILSMSGTSGKDYLTLPALATTHVIYSVQLNVRAICNPAGGTYKRLILGLLETLGGDTETLGSTQDITESYETYTQTWTTKPSTGGSWTKADIDALQMIVLLDKDGSGYIRYDQAWAVVTFSDTSTEYQVIWWP